MRNVNPEWYYGWDQEPTDPEWEREAPEDAPEADYSDYPVTPDPWATGEPEGEKPF